MRLNPKLKEKIMESLSAVLPVTGIVLVLSILIVPVDLGTIAMFFVGAILLVVGMGFFQLGAEMSMEPLGGWSRSTGGKVPQDSSGSSDRFCRGYADYDF